MALPWNGPGWYLIHHPEMPPGVRYWTAPDAILTNGDGPRETDSNDWALQESSVDPEDRGQQLQICAAPVIQSVTDALSRLFNHNPGRTLVCVVLNLPPGVDAELIGPNGKIRDGEPSMEPTGTFDGRDGYQISVPAGTKLSRIVVERIRPGWYLVDPEQFDGRSTVWIDYLDVPSTRPAPVWYDPIGHRWLQLRNHPLVWLGDANPPIGGPSLSSPVLVPVPDPTEQTPDSEQTLVHEAADTIAIAPTQDDASTSTRVDLSVLDDDSDPSRDRK